MNITLPREKKSLEIDEISGTDLAGPFQFNCGAADRGRDLCARGVAGYDLAATWYLRPTIAGLGICGSTVLLLHATLCINSLAHHYGSRDFDTDDHSRNNLFLSIITLGEGWHNNHHYYAGSTRQGFYWWQIDVTYYLLKLMSLFGLVWGLKPIPARVYDVSKIAQARKQKKAAKTGTPIFIQRNHHENCNYWFRYFRSVRCLETQQSA
jgi:hypothetical protein